MKKILSLLFALPLIFAMTACDDDDDLPEVTLNVTYSNASMVDNMLYVVQGDTLTIDSVGVAPSQPNGKNTRLLAVAYRFNGWLVANVPFPPFSAKIVTDNLEAGDYSLGIECPVVQVGKQPATIYAVKKVRIVENAADIPGSPDSEVLGAGGGFTTEARTK